MAGKGHRKTAAKAVALEQKGTFQVAGIIDDVNAHPAMDGRTMTRQALGVYLGQLQENGYLIGWIETGESKKYAVRGGRMESAKEGEKVSVRMLT